MQKNNVKSFICSFLFSILAVAAVQRVFLRADQTSAAPEASSDNMRHPKISLFAENRAVVHEMPVLVSSAPSQSAADVKIAKADLSAPVFEQTAEAAPSAPVFKALETHSENPSAEPVPTDLAYAEEITFSEQEQNLLDEQKHLSQTEVVYADISDTFEDTSMEVADASSSEEIPLVEDNIAVHSRINTQNSASASQIAMIDPSTLINGMEEPDIHSEEKTLAEADIKKNELGEILAISENAQPADESPSEVATGKSEQDVSDALESTDIKENTANSPWVLAKGNKYAKNQAAVEAYTQASSAEDGAVQQTSAQGQNALKTSVTPKEETAINRTFSEPLLKEKENNAKLAYEMIQNILIPIPDNILNDANVTPDLTASPDDAREKPRRITAPKPADLDEKEKQSGLFKSISSWFNKNKDETTGSTPNLSQKKNSKEKPGALKTLKDKVYSALGSVEDYKNLNDVSIMPAELRLSFAPNRAEISGQTLRWIYAFADNARDHNDVYIEVRIDGTSSYALQQKRLNLLSSIFASRGVDYRKINTVFTSREPNSFIIRNIRFNNDYKGETEE